MLENLGQRDAMEKASEIARDVVIGVSLLCLLVFGLIRVIGGFAAIVRLFVHSPLPWWILTPAAIALVAGFVVFFKIRRAQAKTNRKVVA
jgi:hypothetical protein